ncbi:MAG: hypothetical protein LBG92_12320 [Prevotellaceae bacterium]|jgi:hypothetical protein|nr:hypothetical protein [Prevotellaceae bacterium]
MIRKFTAGTEANNPENKRVCRQNADERKISDKMNQQPTTNNQQPTTNNQQTIPPFFNI